MADSARRGALLWRVLVCLLLLGSLLLLRVTWLRWGSAVADVGREVEIPRKIATGHVLYRDMAYNYGPFSPYWNALFLHLLGARLTSIVASGLLCAAAGAFLVYAVSREFLGAVASLALVAVFLLESVFQHYFWNGSFNFILPYSFPAVHGTLFALGALLTLLRWIARGGERRLIVAGVLAGFSALCKIEMAAAIAATLGVAAAAWPLVSGAGLRGAARAMAAWLLPAALVVAAGYAPLVLASSWDVVVRDNVLPANLVDVRSNVFYTGILGLTEVGLNTRRIVVSLVIWAIVAGLLLASARLLGGGGWRRALGAVLALAALVLAIQALPFDLVFRGLPVICLAALGAGAIRMRRPGEGAVESAKIAAFALFALLALGRILLNAGTFHFGFTMALPAVILFAVLLARALPRVASLPPRAARLHVALSLTLLVLLSSWSFLTRSLPLFRARTFPIAGPRGEIRVLPAALHENLAAAIRLLALRSKPGETLLAVPEGVMVNFLLGIENPVYFDTLIPPVVEAPGVEERVIADLERSRVSRILVVDRHMGEYGRTSLFGDSAPRLGEYVRAHYEVEAAFGPPPFTGPASGCVILKRSGGAASDAGAAGPGR